MVLSNTPTILSLQPYRHRAMFCNIPLDDMDVLVVFRESFEMRSVHIASDREHDSIRLLCL